MTRQMHSATYGSLDLVHWNPRVPLGLRPRRLFRWTRRLPVAPRVNNFGDLLGPLVVAELAVRMSLPRPARRERTPLASVGSVIHMLPSGTTVWGSGVNGTSLERRLPERLDVRAVRGPLTRRYLIDRGVAVPEVFGDPGLLVPLVFGDSPAPIEHPLTVIGNLNDAVSGIPGPERISPTRPVHEIVDRIRRSAFVVGSSLHALVVADAFGIPSRPVRAEREPEFKYLDYYLGTGRSGVRLARSVEEALDLGPVERLTWSDGALRAAFPVDLFDDAERA